MVKSRLRYVLFYDLLEYVSCRGMFIVICILLPESNQHTLLISSLYTSFIRSVSGIWVYEEEVFEHKLRCFAQRTQRLIFSMF